VGRRGLRVLVYDGHQSDGIYWGGTRLDGVGKGEC
jgi:hypothetical protein